MLMNAAYRGRRVGLRSVFARNEMTPSRTRLQIPTSSEMSLKINALTKTFKMCPIHDHKSVLQEYMH